MLNLVKVTKGGHELTDTWNSGGIPESIFQSSFINDLSHLYVLFFSLWLSLPPPDF